MGHGVTTRSVQGSRAHDKVRTGVTTGSLGNDKVSTG